MTDMSTKVEFELYFGDHSVGYGPNGVDLSGFSYTKKNIDRPLDRSFGSIYRWLERGFRVNGETQVMRVQALVNWAVVGQRWELMLIRSTEDWKMYMQAAAERGWPPALLIQIHLKSGVSLPGPEDEDEGVPVQAHVEAHEEDQVAGEDIHVACEEDQEPEQDVNTSRHEARGTADEGEIIPGIVEQMEEEDLLAAADDEGESSDEDDGSVPARPSTTDDDSVPACWRSTGFGNPVVSDGPGREWEYRQNEIVQGAKYPSIEDVREAVKLWSVSLRKEFIVVKSTKSTYDVRCANQACKWRVYAHKGKWKSHVECSKVVEHTCVLDSLQKYHRNVTTAFIAAEMHGLIMEKLDYEPGAIIKHIENRFGYSISYLKAWRAKQRVFEMRWGTYEASYDNLPRLLPQLVLRNPGSYYDISSIPSETGGPSVMQRAFFCLGACVRAFQFCLPVLCIDGCFLTGKYRGQILTAIGVDGNYQILPIAFAFVENENTESWYWFLERVKVHVVAARPDVCLISDRHAGLLAAIRRLKEGYGGRLPIWTDVRNRWCIRHMGANFYDHFKNKDLMDMFKRLCELNQERKFKDLWQRLDELAAEYVQERRSAAGTSTGASTSARSSARSVEPFSDWIKDAPKEKWSLLYDTHGSRYGIKTTNIAECYNSVIRPVRFLPLVGIVEFIIFGTATYFRERYSDFSLHFSNPSVLYGPKVSKHLSKKIEKAQGHNVKAMGTREHRFEVQCKDRRRRGLHRGRVTQECLLRGDGSCFCTCHKPRILHRPCSHVIAASVEAGLPARSFVSTYFSKEAIMSVWSHEVYGFGVVGPFTETHKPPLFIPDPQLKRGRGRRQKRRIRNNMDESEAGVATRTCTVCGVVGHSYKTCPLSDLHATAEAGPSGNPGDGAPPTMGRRPSTSAHRRRSVS
jgi:MULE transposase domain/Domain of unknown function (DUF1979)/MuDR family transposase